MNLLSLLVPLAVLIAVLEVASLLVLAVGGFFWLAFGRRKAVRMAPMRYAAGFATGGLVAIGTVVAYYLVDIHVLGGNDREGGLGMSLTFFVLPLLAIILGITGVAIAFATRSKP